ncbi:CBS domain containing membrane protein [Fictibacillus macauensis ZFHKF-1]|uniref:CBS domain containing membrane protein n=1 Tax=Fictibacillus macauensis ZFHKF-1 TaxID=1196324 RepID=I8AGI3_9BACL|nr:CBS domain-containing protein [Fictibacillus macauensis]EIT84792.1 CBS domain containing membrane protein [Fictibacillus macauensis ZFHKF-1]
MKVQDFMISDVYVAHLDQTLSEVMEMLARQNVGGMPVVDHEGKLLSMISDGDILRALKPKSRHMYDFFSFVFYEEQAEFEEVIRHTGATPLRELLPKRIKTYTVSPQDEMEHALGLLAKHHFKKLPVIDEQQHVVGIISRGDIIKKIRNAILPQLQNDQR